MSNSTDKVTKILFIFVSALVLAAIANNFYTFYFQKDYKFIVETPCNSTEQTCFIRDCSDGECPPNELERYRTLSINAADFAQCANDSCLNECTNGSIQCKEIFCDESVGDACTVLSATE